MRKTFFAVPALMLAGAVLAQSAQDPKAKVAPAQYRSAFEGYRPFGDEAQREWRKANEEVRAGKASKPQPGKPESSGHGRHK